MLKTKQKAIIEMLDAVNKSELQHDYFKAMEQCNIVINMLFDLYYEYSKIWNDLKKKEVEKGGKSNI